MQLQSLPLGLHNKPFNFIYTKESHLSLSLLIDVVKR